MADVYALDLKAAYAVDVCGLEFDAELLGPLAGGLGSQSFVVGLVGQEGWTGRTVEPAYGERLGHFLLLCRSRTPLEQAGPLFRLNRRPSMLR